MKKIAFIASSGGHLEEISRLKKVAEMYESFLVTEKSGLMSNDLCDKTIYVRQINRKQITFIPKFIELFIKTFIILVREKPDVIVTTGALVAYPFCILGKFFGKKIVYIESFARVHNASLTGKLVYKFADLFIVQWEDMMKVYDKAVLGGGLF